MYKTKTYIRHIFRQFPSVMLRCFLPFSGLHLLGVSCGKGLEVWQQCLILLGMWGILLPMVWNLAHKSNRDKLALSTFTLFMTPYFSYMAANTLSIYGVDDMQAIGFPALLGLMWIALAPLDRYLEIKKKKPRVPRRIRVTCRKTCN